MLTRQHRRRAASLAFTLVELVVVVSLVVVTIAVLIPTIASARVRSRTTACMNNLKYIGTAFSMYDVETNGEIPPAALRLRHGVEMTWDDWLDFYLGGSLSDDEKWSADYRGTNVMRYLACPEMVRSGVGVDGSQARTYAMPRYIFEPTRSPWPPRVRSRAGAGVVWDFRDGDNPDSDTVSTWELAEYRRADGLIQAQPVRRQSAVTMGIMRRPAGTLAMVERPGKPSIRGAMEGSFIDTAADQISLAGGRIESTQARNFPHKTATTYLMFDGHVEMGLPEQTIGTNAPIDRQSGLWTISPRD